MRYAVFTDIHANLEALEAVLAKIDELSQEEAIDHIWFLGDLVGYGPNPNECIDKLCERTDVIIAGNHDWAAVGKIDLEDFSAAARISAEWTASQLTQEHKTFLADLPERLEIDECTLVHGSPYGPLWEYLTSEALAERSFQYFSSRYCLVGHTHIPVIFQQPDTIAQIPTIPLSDTAQSEAVALPQEAIDDLDDEETQKMVAIRPGMQTTGRTVQVEHAHIETELSSTSSEKASSSDENQQSESVHTPSVKTDSSFTEETTDETEQQEEALPEEMASIEEPDTAEDERNATVSPTGEIADDEDFSEGVVDTTEAVDTAEQHDGPKNGYTNSEMSKESEEATPENIIADAEERLNSEIEELLALLGLSESMVKVTNEMLVPPEGDWQAPEDYRAIINPGGVGQPRDGDPRAAFMIYDTERGFTFYRIPYNYEKTQEKIIKAGLPPYLAARLSYGR